MSSAPKMIILLSLVILSLDSSDATQRVPTDRHQWPDKTNWTTCDEFLEGVSFNASSILDKDWRVFYAWSWWYDEPYQIRFSEPTPTLIDRFRVELGKDSFAPNMNNTEFFMESTMDMSALFIKTATPGRYKVVTSLVFAYNMSEDVIFALKMVDPGYLAFMNCNIQVVIALATPDMFPKDNELEEAAKLFKIKHSHGYPYNVHQAMLKYDPALDHGKDEHDDIQTEIELSSGMLD